MTDKITFRLWPPYTDKIREVAKAARLKPNQLARIATISVTDGGLLNLSERLGRIEDELIRLRQDFNSAVGEEPQSSEGKCSQ